jgi:hypothetical protein
VTVGDALDAVDWDRQGIPHFLQAHAFTSRGRRELRANDDVAMQERIERIFSDLRAIPRPRPGPSRDELIEVMRTALAASPAGLSGLTTR